MPDTYDAIVIGSGFGGAVAITKLADKSGPGLRVLVLERGTWWRNPEGPGLRKHKTTSPPPIEGDWQYWARPNDALGLTYVANSIYKEKNPITDLLNPFERDNDLGVKRNRKGLYRLTRFSHKHGNVDVVSGNAVGGGSLFYSGVNLIPHAPVLKRVGLGHLESGDFRKAGEWMKDYRGHINKINTKIPVPHYEPKTVDPAKHLQLAVIPESGDSPAIVGYEMPNPELSDTVDGDYLLLDRARVLKRAMERVVSRGGFADGTATGSVFGGGFEPLPLSVLEYEPKEDSDSTKKNTFCTREGRCILGCLPSARHTLYKTIRNLQEKGADITVQPLAKVSHVSKKGDDFVVHFQSYLDGDDGKEATARGRRVFVGAGTLGTTEILLRSQKRFEDSKGEEGLPLSPMVGRSFSTNGDFFGFTHEMARDRETRKSIPDDTRIGNANPTAGPINSSHFYVVFDENSPEARIDVNVEDAGIPTPFARLVHGLLPHMNDLENVLRLGKALVSILLGREPFVTSERPDPEDRDQEEYLTERELLQDVFFYNLMGTGPNDAVVTFSLQSDGSGLELSYDPAKPLADWPVFHRQEAVMEQLTSAMTEGAHVPKLKRSPFWASDERRITVVHPLGGVPIGDGSDGGAVDDFGRLYDGASEDEKAVHKGLYVVDAAAIPGALGVNPTFTIVTHAVRAVDHAIADL